MRAALRGGWFRTLAARLFGDGSSITATIVAAGLFGALAIPFARWAVLEADFGSGGPASCTHVGACWPFIADKMGQLAYGFYPRSAWWQVNLAVVVITAGYAGGILLAGRYQVLLACAAFFGTVVLGYLAFAGALPGMATVPVESWGGLSITFLLFAIGTGVSVVFGGLLAIGRRSKAVLIQSICSVYVELMRGIPLIAILFIAVVMLPLFLPGGADGNFFLRVLAGICLYTAAYMAEVIRAGLDAVRPGDREAALALGLSRWNTEKLVVFPQALIVSVPGLVSTLIGLVKDTSLVIIVGMHDFLGSTHLAMTDIAWGNVLWEGYIFAAVVYFVLCYGLASLGTRIEVRSRRHGLGST